MLGHTAAWSTAPMRRRRLLRLAALGYLVLLHAVVVVLLAKTDILVRAGRRLGLAQPEERFPALVVDVVEQARADLAAAEGGAPLVLLGDSIATQLDAGRIADGAVNYGIGGDTMRTLLWRLPLLRSVARARAAAVNVGVNDLKFRTVPAVADDYRALVAAFPPAVALAMVSPLPVDERVFATRQNPGLNNASLRALGAAMRPVCEARPRCRFVDAWPVFEDPATGGMRPGLHNGDGVHLSEAGSRALEALLRNAVSALAGAGGARRE